MKIYQIRTKLNNTELGKGRTHESYVLVKKGLDVSCVFNTENEIVSFVSKRNNKEVKLRRTVGREIRIVGLGEFYRENELNAGDELIFEKVIGEEEKYFLDFTKKKNTVVLQKTKGLFQVLTEKTLHLIEDEIIRDQNNNIVKLELSEKIRKRKDSPQETDLYNLYIGTQRIDDDYSNNELIEIIVEDKVAIIANTSLWNKSILEWED